MATKDPTPEQFAAEVARMGAKGLSQKQIAGHLKMSRAQVEYRLLQSGYKWTSQVRVQEARTGEDLLAEASGAAQ